MDTNINPLKARAEAAMQEWKLTPEGQAFHRYAVSIAMSDRRWQRATRYATDEEVEDGSFDALTSKRYDDLASDPEDTRLKKLLFEKELKLVRKLMKELSPRHKDVIEQHIFKDKAFSQLTGRFGVNRQRVWDIYWDAVYRLIARLEYYHRWKVIAGVPDKMIRTRANALKAIHRSKNKQPIGDANEHME